MGKFAWLGIDFNNWHDEESDEVDEDMFNFDQITKMNFQGLSSMGSGAVDSKSELTEAIKDKIQQDVSTRKIEEIERVSRLSEQVNAMKELEKNVGEDVGQSIDDVD